MREGKNIDISGFSLENHVEQSLRVVMALAGDRPVNAGDLLTGALIAGRTISGSRAFAELASMAPLSGVSDISELKVSEEKPTSLLVNGHLDEAFSVAEPFLKEAKAKIWGRDYITLALLVDKDPSLRDFAEKADTTVEDLQDRWYRFVTSQSSHRGPESWEKWWSMAGVPLPEQRGASTKSQWEFDSAAMKKGGVEDDAHETFLLTWSPTGFSFEKFAEIARQVEETGKANCRWSTGQRTTFSVGDRVFLMRQGKDRPGIVGSGRMASEVFDAPHWNEELAKEGRQSNYADVAWDALREYPLINLEELVELTGEKKLWTNQGSGFRIDPGVAGLLESAWTKARQTFRDEDISDKISGGYVPLAWVDTDAIPVIGQLRDYRPSTLDSLDVNEQAKIFAALLVADKVRPPLALGLFGDWGVGKTFFMRLMQETVAFVAGKDAQPESASESVSRAAQIEFNAWHYVDSDLWASLASHIFDGLSEELRGPNDTVEEIRRRLRRSVNSSKRERKEATAAIEAAQQERKQAAFDLKDRREKRERVAALYDSNRLKRVWRAVLAIKPDRSKPKKKDWPDVSALKSRAQKVSKRLGISDAIDSAEEATRVYRSICDLSGRGAALARAFAADFTGGRVFLSALIVSLLLGAIVAWPWILGKIENSFDFLEGSLVRWISPFLQLSTVAGAAIAWAVKNLKTISSAMDCLEQLQEELRNPRIRLPKPSICEIRLKRGIEKLDTDIAAERLRMEEAERQIAEAQAEIQRINAGGLVYDFLEERVRDTRYLDRLGLISVIRRDFEKLSGLLADWRRHGGQGLENGDGSTDKAPDSRPIERIILYIDDLDRCPPKRVVEVLQAVHLLLAFDLFVVVVAVDPRWLERSLNEAYNPGGDDGNWDFKALPRHRFSAHNYMEKIFQIPFSLPEMEKEGYRKLIASLVSTPRSHAEEKMAERLDKGEAPVEMAEAQDDAKTLEPPVGKTESPDEDAIEEGGKKVDGGLSASETKIREQEEKAREQEQIEAGKRIGAMLLDKSEEQFIAALHVFIGTPRLAKRFVNIYRLIRVRAASLDGDFSSFIRRDTGDYRAVLALLAVVVGRADVASDILFRLNNCSDGGGIFDWLGNAFVCDGELASEDGGRSEPENLEIHGSRLAYMEQSFSSDIQTAAVQIRLDMEKVVEALEELGGPPFDDRLETYRKWANEVGRFSFRWRLRMQGARRTPRQEDGTLDY